MTYEFTEDNVWEYATLGVLRHRSRKYRGLLVARYVQIVDGWCVKFVDVSGQVHHMVDNAGVRWSHSDDALAVYSTAGVAFNEAVAHGVDV